MDSVIQEVETEQEFAAKYPQTPVPVYRTCKDVARKQSVITYEELNNRCELSLDYGDISHRTKISNMLGDVSEFEVRKGRPMLSVVVVLKGSKPMSPGDGFFHWAAKIGVARLPKENKQKFFARILGETHRYWVSHP